MTLKELALKLWPYIEAAAQKLDDTTALEAVELFPAWKADTQYATGQRVRFSGTLYLILQDHTSQSDWTPDVAPSLYARVLISDPDVIPDWEQPDNTNPFQQGDKVRHNGKIWVSDINNNVWEPGVYGWSEVVE